MVYIFYILLEFFRMSSIWIQTMTAHVEQRVRSASSVARRLPAFSPVALQLLRLVFQDNVSFGSIAKLLTLDPVLSSEVLRIANSGLFRRSAEIKSVLHALAIVGLDRVSAVVVASSLWRGFPNPPHPLVRTWWRHAVATAFISEHASRNAGIDHAYTAGLLHSIGQLALILEDTRAYGRMVDDCVTTAGALEDLEAATLGMNSAAVSRALATQWQLPRDLANSMGHYNTHTAETGLTNTVATGCVIAEYLGFGACTCNRELTPEDLPARARSMVERGDLLTVIAERINALECSLMPS
jgi:HD-like signal output (HDOD) protein